MTQYIYFGLFATASIAAMIGLVYIIFPPTKGKKKYLRPRKAYVCHAKKVSLTRDNKRHVSAVQNS